MSNKAVPFPTEEERLRMECAAALAANHGLGIVVRRLEAALQEIIAEDYGLQSPHQKRMAEIARRALSPDIRQGE